MTLNKPEDIELAIQEVKEVLEQANTQKERKKAEEMLEHFRKMRNPQKREGLLIFSAEN